VDFYESLTFKSGGTPIDVTGYTFKLALRKEQSLASSVLLSITNTSNPAVDGIKLTDPTNGVITLRITSTSLQALITNPATTADEINTVSFDYYYYDLKVTDTNGITYAYMAGIMYLYSGIAL
jgi:hypothetical protein